MKAIDTVYNGYKFRSRLEARWAVFFDTLGISYQYETEGFDLNGTWYLPDFWLPDPKCYVEIKPKNGITEDAKKKCEFIARDYNGKSTAIISGDPYFGEFEAMVYLRDKYNDFIQDKGSVCWDIFFNRNDARRFIFALYLSHLFEDIMWFEYQLSESYEYDEIEEAFLAARQARFEHK